MERFVPYLEADLSILNLDVEGGLPLRITHPADQSRSTLLQYAFDEIGPTGEKFVCFNPNRLVRGLDSNNPNSRDVRLKATILFVDRIRRELRIGSEIGKA